MMRVLLLSHDMSQTGAPKVALDVFRHLQDRAQVWTLAINGGPRLGDFEALGPVTLFADLPPAQTPVGRLRRRLTRSAWSARMRRWKPEILYVNTVAALPLVRYFSLPQDAPVLLHVHELEGELAKHLRHEPERENFIRRPHRYIAVSEAVRTALVERWNVPTEKTALIHEFVPADEFADVEATGDSSRPHSVGGNGRFVVGGMGYPNWRKAPLLWLLVAAELRGILGSDAVRFVWVGVNEDDASGLEFRTMVRRLGLEDIVEIVPVTREPRKHLSRFDVLAMTSLEDPCPLVVLEAMLLERPVACFDNSGGAPEEVGETGLVIPGFSPRAMAVRLADLAREPERRAALGRAARQRALRHFTDAVQVPKIWKEMESLTHASSLYRHRDG